MRSLASRSAVAGLGAEADGRGREGLHAEIAPGEALANQGRQAERHRGGDLDGLQDDAVGEGVGGADAEAGVEDADHGELEDADVGGVAGTTAVTLTANSTAAAAPMPAWPLRPSA